MGSGSKQGLTPLERGDNHGARSLLGKFMEQDLARNTHGILMEQDLPSIALVEQDLCSVHSRSKIFARYTDGVRFLLGALREQDLCSGDGSSEASQDALGGRHNEGERGRVWLKPLRPPACSYIDWGQGTQLIGAWGCRGLAPSAGFGAAALKR